VGQGAEASQLEGGGGFRVGQVWEEEFEAKVERAADLFRRAEVLLRVAGRDVGDVVRGKGGLLDLRLAEEAAREAQRTMLACVEEMSEAGETLVCRGHIALGTDPEG